MSRRLPSSSSLTIQSRCTSRTGVIWRTSCGGSLASPEHRSGSASAAATKTPNVEPIGSALLIVGAYAIGAVPWGVVLGRVSTGTDLRHYGSHSTGATNAYRVLGKRAAIAVLVLDFLKGLVPVV